METAPVPASARSYLYVPGDRDDRLQKALTRGADALIIDLEDAVASSGKSLARDLVAGWTRTDRPTVVTWVRINADEPEADIRALAGPIAGVMVAKAEPALLETVSGLLAERERALGLPDGTFAMIPLIETARGLLEILQLASAPRVSRLALGRADLAGELGLDVEPEGPEFGRILLDLVIASSAAGIAAPIAPTSTDFRDLEALKASTERMLGLGLRGRTAIHPAQLPVINEVFTPSENDVESAERLLAAFTEAERAGSGVAVDDDGRMVDAAVVRVARDVVARAQASGPRPR